VGPLPSFPFTVDSFALELPIFCPELESRIQKAAAVPSCVIRAALCGWTINSAKSQKRYHFPPPPGTKLFPLFHLRSSLTPAEPQVFLHICVTVAVSGHQLGHLRMCKTPPALLLSTFPLTTFCSVLFLDLTGFHSPNSARHSKPRTHGRQSANDIQHYLSLSFVGLFLYFVFIPTRF